MLFAKVFSKVPRGCVTRSLKDLWSEITEQHKIPYNIVGIMSRWFAH